MLCVCILHAFFATNWKHLRFATTANMSMFFSCGAKHAVAGTLFGCMAGNNVATSGALFKNPKMFVKYTCNLSVILKFSAGLLRRV